MENTGRMAGGEIGVQVYMGVPLCLLCVYLDVSTCVHTCAYVPHTNNLENDWDI